MRLPTLALLAVSTLAAADEARLALEAKGLADFERVQKALSPPLGDATLCIQSQAALLPITTLPEVSALYYRKGYCTLASAAVTDHASEYAAAAAEFEKAILHWPSRAALTAKKGPPDPLPSGLRVLSAIAALRAGADDAGVEKARGTIATALVSPQCGSPLMAEGLCDSVLRLGRQWLGWIDLRRNQAYAAVRNLVGALPSGWTAWADGRKAFDEGNFREAALQYRRAMDAWEARRQASVVTFLERLGPAADLRAGYADLGAAQLLSGDPKTAAATLTRSIKEDPSDARALFLRARARELSGQPEEALTDYNLASRAAFAAAQDLASGEAHLYRGILLYHRKDYVRAEDEFASALNFEIPGAFRGDAAAWRHLAAVAAGNCAASRNNLEYALASVSPYVPKEEARNRSLACATNSALAPRAKPAN